MQFHLEATELNLLADILLALSSTSHAYDSLLEKILARDLRLDADELEMLSDLLLKRKQDMKQHLAQLQNTEVSVELRRKLATLERVLERVNEACVMF